MSALREAIVRLVEGRDLSGDEAEAAMGAIMAGEATDAQIGAFMAVLRLKGETVEEVAGCARAMRARATRVSTGRRPLVDTCGTGGDGSGTFNISTTAAFVVAGAGVAVAKHGNRSVSSRAGSADVLEALGVVVDLPPEAVTRCIEEVGIGFCFAPRFHPSMRHAAGPRRELGIRTVFNLLGPLTNPAGAEAQVVGVYDPALTEMVASVLGRLGCRRAFVVHGAGGLDEFSTAGPTRVSELRDGRVETYWVLPTDVGLSTADVAALRGGDAAENAGIALAVLRGERGPRRDVVLLNAAAALVAAGAAADLRAGVALAAESIDGGRALAALEGLRRLTQAAAQRTA